MTEIRKGDRVRLTGEARRWNISPRAPNRLGAATRSFILGGYVSVRWDGTKSASLYHPDFIELAFPVRPMPPDDEPLPPEIARRFAHVEITE